MSDPYNRVGGVTSGQIVSNTAARGGTLQSNQARRNADNY